MSVKVHFDEKKVRVAAGQTLFEIAESMGVQVPTSCLKQGKCKECLVEVTDGMSCLSGRTAEESHLSGNFRLSCRSQVVSESGVIRCQTMRRGAMRIENCALDLPLKSDRKLLDPAVTLNGDCVLLEGEEIDRQPDQICGLALDLGTTTVVLRLINLETGEVCADASFENPQRFGGSDIMARIHYAGTHGSRVLRKTLTGYLKHAIESLPVSPHNIYEVVVAGNSTMRDLFFGLDVHSIGQSPYQSITEIELAHGQRVTTSLSLPAKRLGLPVNPKARVYGLPIISGHVGADAAACMLAVDMANEERLVAIMDIGTNTELIVGNKHRVLATSCPAGPAFEGGNITFGMPALTGAIERVKMNGDCQAQLEVIGGGAAEGICGSGLVDLLSELHRTGRINSLGRFENGDVEFALATNDDQVISFHEKDINELAQAKGANVAGLHIICEEYGIDFDDLDVFYLAGGFGRHIEIPSAKRIGLIPDIDDAKIVKCGNIAIEGASIALLSLTRRKELEWLVRQVKHCRLETHTGFFNYFVEGCQFNPLTSYSLT